MKVKVQNYTFNVATKRVTFLDYSTLRLDSLLLITNVTRNVIIYNFADTEAGATISGNIVTLKADLTGMLNTDQLQIFYESADIPATEGSILDLGASLHWLKRIADLVEPLSTQDAASRVRINIDAVGYNSGTLPVSMSSLPTLANVTTISNLQNIGGVDYRWPIFDNARAVYAAGVRANLKFS